jgi:hypothetical protein
MKNLPKSRQASTFRTAVNFRLLPFFLSLCLACCPATALPETSGVVSPEDIELLNKIEKDTLQYFIRMSDKNTGLTRDSSQQGSPASIAATGFSLAAFAIGQSRGWIEKEYAQKYIEKTLKTLIHKAAHKNGFFYHFLDMKTGKRVWDSEASSIDTALLLAGALLAAQYYPNSSIQKMAHALYERINWEWMMNGSDFICMGWKPESGFLPYYWDTYCEHIILQALASGAPANPVPSKTWIRWMRHEARYRDKAIIHSPSGSLFTYQYAQAFIDFRELDDQGINYFNNSKLATEANREYSLEFSGQFKSYSKNSWGLSASLGPGGYKAYGAKPGEGLQDGTIAPYAAISSIIFTPELSAAAARYFYETHGEKIYDKFGFRDAFNVDKNWWANETIGIDQGIIIVMLENFLNHGAVWTKFMALPAIQNWIEKNGLKRSEQPAIQAS